MNLGVTLFPELAEYASDIDTYDKLYDFSVNEQEKFWGKTIKERLQWFKPFDQVCNTYDLNSFNDPDFRIKWFIGGKMNASVNCVDRHLEKNPEKIVLIWEKDEPGTQEYFTYRQLYETMNQIANMLKAHGIKKGDCVAIYSQASNYVAACMLACARIGAVHTSIYSEFPPHAIAIRINEAECVALITDNQGRRNGQVVEIKTVADEALKSCPTVKHTFVINRTNAKYEINDSVINLVEEMEKYPKACEPEQMNSEDPLFIAFTSGSTGKPKALVYPTAGFLSIYGFHQLGINYYKVVNFFIGDIAWITFHSFLYGSLFNGSSCVLFDSTILYPNPGRLWEIIEKHKVNYFTLFPNVTRLLIIYGDAWPSKYDLSSLKRIIVGGEILDEKLWTWLFEIVGKRNVDVLDAYGGSECAGALTGKSFINSKDNEIKQFGLYKVISSLVVILDDDGNELTANESVGHVCMKNALPSIVMTIKNNHQAYIDTYFRKFPGYFYTGDLGMNFSNGSIKIIGREDDVIKVRALRIGSFEIEEVVNSHPRVSDSAAVPTPHEIYTNTPYMFLVLRGDKDVDEEQVINELRSLLETRIVTYGRPTHYLIVDALPKTKTGKTMRRVLRKIAANEYDNMGDLSSIEDITVIESIKDKHILKYGQK